MKFNPVYIDDATSIDDAWFKLLHGCYHKGRRYLVTNGSHAGEYRAALDDAAGFIHYPHQRPLSPIIPEGIPAPTSDDVIEKYWLETLMNGELLPGQHYIYGQWIVGGRYNIPKGQYFTQSDNYPISRHNFPVKVPNQLEWIINHFKTAGFGNEHCYLTVGYPESNFAYDIPYTNEMERQTSPCLRGLDFRIITELQYECPNCHAIVSENQTITSNGVNILCPYDRKILHNQQSQQIHHLTTKVIYRSWDLWSGFPENMGGFTLLNEFVANELGIEPGPLSFVSKSLHVYSHAFDVLKLRMGEK